MNEIVLILNDKNQLRVKMKNPMSFEDLLQVTQTAVLGHAKQVMEQVPQDDVEEVKGAFYDLMNQAFSRTLEFFAPELELHPNLTAQAILEAENALIEKAYKGKVVK